MDGRLSSSKGYLVAEPYHPNLLDISCLEMESFYNNCSDPKKVTTQTSAQMGGWGNLESRTQLDLLGSSRDPVDLATYTSVTVDESKLLDEFMAFAPDFGCNKSDRKNLTDLTSTIGSSLSELENVEQRLNPQMGGGLIDQNPSSCYTSLSASKSLPTSLLSSVHEQENRFPHKRRIHSAFAANTSHGVGSKSLKVMKQKPVGSLGGFLGESQEPLEGVGGTSDRWGNIGRGGFSDHGGHSDMGAIRGQSGLEGSSEQGGVVEGNGGRGGSESRESVSLLRQQLQGTLSSSKYKKSAETVCKDCNQIFTAKCLLKVCRKSDEVLCQRCGQELTAKCLLQVCPEKGCDQDSF